MRIDPGMVALIGSGETAPSGGQVFEKLTRDLPVPLYASVLETPAGFELNSSLVAGRVADFLLNRLQNNRPKVEIIAARKKGTKFSPESEDILKPLLTSDLIFLGPGSPSYTVRQLAGSLAWDLVRARHRQGAALALASAAAIASGHVALPVYEIFKVGEDPHWKTGLDLFAPYGLSLVIIPHWNNAEGGKTLDTSYCFMGETRFQQLLNILPAGDTVVGLDEHTSLILDLGKGTARVAGISSVHILSGEKHLSFHEGETFPLDLMGSFHPLDDPEMGIDSRAWQMTLQAQVNPQVDEISEEIERLVQERQHARHSGDWAEADRLRLALHARGWNVKDTPDGPILEKK